MTVPLTRWTDRIQQAPISDSPVGALVDGNSWRPSLVFLAAGLPFALALLVLTPPFQVPDEPAHFFRSYMISEGRLRAEFTQSSSGGVLPSSLQRVADDVMQGIPFHPEVKQDLGELQRLLKVPLKLEDRVETHFPGAALYFPLVYLPQAAGIALGRAFEASPLVLMYLGRLLNALAALALTMLAIRIMPVHRWTMVVLALTPMVAFTRASVSADAFTLSACWVLIAVLLRYALTKQQPLGARDVALLFAITAVVALTKQTYFLLAGCLLLLPRSTLGSGRRYVIVLVTMLGTAFLATTIWSGTVRELYRPEPAHANIKGQTALVLSNPLRVVGILLKDLYTKRVDYLEMGIGRLGWLDTPMPRGAMWTLFCLLVAIAIFDSHGSFSLSLKQRAVLIATFLATALAIAGALYITWTPLGAQEVIGVQGRYFLPLAPLMFLVFYNRGLARIRQLRFLKAGLVGAYVCVSITVTVLMLLDRFWGVA